MVTEIPCVLICDVGGSKEEVVTGAPVGQQVSIKKPSQFGGVWQVANSTLPF